MHVFVFITKFKVCSVTKHEQSSKHTNPQGFVAQESSHLVNELGKVLDEIVTERLDMRLAAIERSTEVLTNKQMAFEQKQWSREDDLQKRILYLQKLASSVVCVGSDLNYQCNYVSV